MKSLSLFFLVTAVSLSVSGCKKEPQTTAQPTESEKPTNQEKTEEPAAFAVTVTGSGQPMILIPGLSCGGNVWEATVNHFKDRYECHVLTLAGFAGQPAIGEGPFLEKVRDELVEYINNEKLERPVVVGHSLGGFMAFWLAATEPEKVGPIISVDGVPYYAALMNPSATPESVQQQAETMRNMYKTQTREQFTMQNRQFLSMMITDQKDLEKVAELSNKSNPRTMGQAFYEMMTIDLREKVKAIRTGVLLLGATSLVPDPEMKKRFEMNYRSQVAAIPRHKVVFAPKARHFIQLDEPEFFIREVESFLRTEDKVNEE